MGLKVVNNSNQIIHLSYGGTLEPGENELDEEIIKANKNHPGFKQQLKDGIIEMPEEEGQEENPPSEDEGEETKEEEWPKPTSEGSPWYFLSNGEKVMGEKKAIEAQKELDEQGEE